jgi:hypothetical protein
MDLWKEISLDEDKCYEFRLGPLTLWLSKHQDELLVAERRLNPNLEPDSDWEQVASGLSVIKNSEITTWKRWVIGKRSRRLQLLPVMPNRPVIVRPESLIQIIPERSIMFYISIPVWIRIVLDGELIITDIPTQILSNIWFGEPLSGYLCYSVKSRALTDYNQKRAKPYTALCPVIIENNSTKNFVFNRLSIHTEHLGIYSGKKHLWTNSIAVNLEGEDQRSAIEFSESAPNFEPTVNKLSNAREIISKKLYRKIFSDFSFIRG